MSRILARAGIVVLGLAAAVMLAEVTVRVGWVGSSARLLPFPYQREAIVRSAGGSTYIQFDPRIGWTVGPNMVGSAGGAVYRSNSAGARADRDYESKPQPEVPRLAAFGDSFTHCDDVDYEDCWTALLEQAWRGSEVLNFGVPGGSPDQGWLRYQSDGRAHHPCMVLIGHQVENINRVVNAFRPFYAPESGIALSKPRFVLDGDGLTLLPNPARSVDQLLDPRWAEAVLGPRDYWYFPGMFADSPLDGLQMVRVARTAAYNRHLAGIEATVDEERPLERAYQADQERFQVAGRVLIGFAREVRQDGATPVVVVFGRKKEVVLVRHDEPKPYAPLLDWLEREKITVIDVTDQLAREANRVGADRLFSRDGHYSPSGNRVVAARLARDLPRLATNTCPAG